MTRYDIWLRRMRRKWNDAAFWTNVGDWLAGYGVLIVVGLAAIMFLAAWLRLR